MNEQAAGNDHNMELSDNYQIPIAFNNVNEMMEHWEIEVLPRLLIHKSAWRKHLGTKDKKYFPDLKKSLTALHHYVKRE